MTEMNNYTAFEGKIVVGFSKEQIESHDVKGSIKIVNQKNPSEYSIERGKVLAVNKHQAFFRPGDDVLMHYIVFTDGRSNMVTSPSRQLWKDYHGNEFTDWFPNGHEAYWAYDGTEQGDKKNQCDLYARLHLDERGKLESIEMLPGYISVSGPPPAPEKVGSLYLPNTVKTLEGKTGVRTILHISDHDRAAHDLDVGDQVYLQTEYIFPVESDVGNFWIARPVYFLYSKRGKHFQKGS